MTEYDVNNSTIMEFMVSMVAFWLLFTVAVVVLYVAWPYVVKAYWKVAYAYYWACRKAIRNTRGADRSRYNGY